MSQQSPILVPDSDEDDVSVASAGAVEARRLQEQFDAEARRARGDDAQPDPFLKDVLSELATHVRVSGRVCYDLKEEFKDATRPPPAAAPE